MAYSSRCWAALVALALMLFSSAAPAKAISCPQTLAYLMPCEHFLMGIGEISFSCCLGAQALARAAVSQADRMSLCHCLKQIALSADVNQKNAQQIPQLCQMDVPITIQPDVNCDLIPAGDLALATVFHHQP